MRYAYFPGCSLDKNAAAYDQSFRAVIGVLAQELVELDDWNCCGASEYFSINPLPAYALVARNLALMPSDLDDVVAPCSMCYINLYKTDHNMGLYPQLNADVNEALAEARMSYKPGSIRVRHALDILVNDVGCEAIQSHVKQPLKGLRLAPYYGCLIVRPDHGFDNPEYPMTLDRLLEELGATVIDFPLKASCCGGHMPQISPESAYSLIHELVATASDRGADAIVTVCPMCHLNIDMYQNQANRHVGTNYIMPILYFTQMMGLAFGFSGDEMGFGQELVSAEPILRKLASPPEEETKPARPRPDKRALPMPRMP
jgi:heterodisulfide reductase subunit B